MRAVPSVGLGQKAPRENGHGAADTPLHFSRTSCFIGADSIMAFFSPIAHLRVFFHVFGCMRRELTLEHHTVMGASRGPLRISSSFVFSRHVNARAELSAGRRSKSFLENSFCVVDRGPVIHFHRNGFNWPRRAPLRVARAPVWMITCVMYGGQKTLLTTVDNTFDEYGEGGAYL